MQFGYFPKVWKTTLVLAFPKSGKAHSSPSNYTPISLLSVLSKIYETILHSQIIKYLEEENVIINEQFGFKPKYSTVAQLLRLTERFAFEINKNINAALIEFCSISRKRLTLIWYSGFLYKLYLIGLSAYIIKIMHSYLMNLLLIYYWLLQR